MNIEPVSFFISYAHQDEELASILGEMLKTNLENIKEIKFWTDRKLVLGENWKDEINNQIKNIPWMHLVNQ